MPRRSFKENVEDIFFSTSSISEKEIKKKEKETLILSRIPIFDFFPFSFLVDSIRGDTEKSSPSASMEEQKREEEGEEEKEEFVGRVESRKKGLES